MSGGSGLCRRPIFAFGNSDGDQHAGMDRGWRRRVRYGPGAYDRQSHISRLDKALDEATTKGWTVDMKNGWKVIFRVQKE
jgi:hypothetical protein